MLHEGDNVITTRPMGTSTRSLEEGFYAVSVMLPTGLPAFCALCHNPISPNVNFLCSSKNFTAASG